MLQPNFLQSSFQFVQRIIFQRWSKKLAEENTAKYISFVAKKLHGDGKSDVNCQELPLVRVKNFNRALYDALLYYKNYLFHGETKFFETVRYT